MEKTLLAWHPNRVSSRHNDAVQEHKILGQIPDENTTFFDIHAGVLHLLIYSLLFRVGLQYVYSLNI